MVWESAPDALILVGVDGVIWLANGEAERLFGYDRDELVGMTVEDVVPPEAVAVHTQHRRDYADQPRRRPMGIGLRLEALHRRGHRIPVDVSLAPLELGGQSCTLAAVRDMSDRNQVESQLVDATRRQLLQDERDRVARDLHDTVIQELFALGMQLQATVSDIGDAGAAERVESTVEAIDGVIRQIRGLIFDVAGDEDVDIRSQIVDVAARLTPTLGFEPRLSFEGPVESVLSTELVDEIVPIVREALTNVAKHADASMADVVLQVGDNVELRVVDDGRGIPSDAPRGNGLGNLTRRAVLLGGRLEVEPGSDGGTELNLSIPID